MDVVYVCRTGENQELRYSLRSLKNVPRETIHIVGGHPSWINTNTVRIHRRPAASSKYATTTRHLEYACKQPSISDPFMLWNDDFYAIQPVTEIPHMHRGELDLTLKKYRTLTSTWAQGMRVTAQHLKRLLPEQTLYSYEVHVPLVVYKSAMLRALKIAQGLRTRAPHKRTIYGNLAKLEGVRIADPKISNKTDPRPDGAWLSSDDPGFAALVAPILKGLFTEPCQYER